MTLGRGQAPLHGRLDPPPFCDASKGRSRVIPRAATVQTQERWQPGSLPADDEVGCPDAGVRVAEEASTLAADADPSVGG